jgi:hypothetical protein
MKVNNKTLIIKKLMEFNKESAQSARSAKKIT